MTYDELKPNKENLSNLQDDEMHLIVSLPIKPSSNVKETSSNAEYRMIKTQVNERNTYPDQSRGEVVNLTLTDITSRKMITKYATKSLSLATLNKYASLLIQR